MMDLENDVHNGTNVLEDFALPYNTHIWLLGPLIDQYHIRHDINSFKTSNFYIVYCSPQYTHNIQSYIIVYVMIYGMLCDMAYGIVCIMVYDVVRYGV